MRSKFPAMRFMRFLLPLLGLCLIAGASKPKVTVRFHVQVNEVTGEPFSMNTRAPGSNENLTLSKVSSINETDIKAIYPFPAPDGSIGCAFRLDAHGQLMINTLSTESRGATLVGFINGRPVTAMLIDRQITDGMVVINQGILPEELQLLVKAFPVLGQNQNKKGQAPVAPATPKATPKPASIPRATPLTTPKKTSKTGSTQPAPIEMLPSRD